MTRPTETRGLPFLMILVALYGVGAGAPCARGAEFQLTPSLALSEEYNDNVLESPDHERSDFVTRVRPALGLRYGTPKLSGEAAYFFDYHNYARSTKGDEKIHNLNARGNAAFPGNLLYLELSDTFSRVSLDVARDVAGESSFLNQTDQNRAVASPYLLWRRSEQTLVKTGYRFSDIRYWTVSGSAPGIDKQVHRGFLDLSHDPSARLTLSAGYAFSSADTERIDYLQHDLNTGLKYQYADNSFLYGGLGNSWQSFSDSRDASNLFWNAGVSHDFGLLVATVEATVLYAEDPLAVSTKETSYTAKLVQALQHGSVGLSGSYSEYRATRIREDDRDKTAFSGFANVELTPRLSGNLFLTGDKVTGSTVSGFPYHLKGSAGISYGFNYDITVGLSYTYVDYRRDLESAAGARQTNRVMLEAKKVFAP